VSGLSPTCTNNFTHGVSGGCNILKGDGEDTEEKDLMVAPDAYLERVMTD
jgi:hypothetical protein